MDTTVNLCWHCSHTTRPPSRGGVATIFSAWHLGQITVIVLDMIFQQTK
ncbi:hypothetical protein SALWKB2_1617 [Snodgrassella alvi wkB2]|nr:hypothetical protein SALWKB2_1617 [Snodgrassella alvi wkB2]